MKDDTRVRRKVLQAKLDSGDDVDLFMAGACCYLALEIHALTNLPIRFAKLSEDDKIAHAWCALPGNEIGIDANGKRPDIEIRRRRVWGHTQTISMKDLEKELEQLDDEKLSIQLRERARAFIQNHLRDDLDLEVLKETRYQ